MIRKYVDGDIDAVMQIWLNTNIQAHCFISPDYYKSNFDAVKEMLPLAEIYVHEIGNTNQIDGFIGLNNDCIEGIFIKEVAQSKGAGMQQALEYADTLDIPVAISSNGDGFVIQYRKNCGGTDASGNAMISENVDLDHFPTPSELWECYKLWKSGCKKRILYLADRNNLITQTKI